MVRSGESPYIYGLHDREGAHLLQGQGWVVISEALGCDPNDRSGCSYADLADQGLGVIVRLNLGYHPTGTIPPPEDYAQFARRCGNYVESSNGCHIWIIGNEPNLAVERPSGKSIWPTMYAHCFRLCRREIRRRPGHRDDQVIVAAVGPWNVETELWIDYFSTVLWELNPASPGAQSGAKPEMQLDGIALHVYSRGSDPGSILDDTRMDPPFDRWRSGFRAYRDFMEAIPGWARHLPVYVTECNQIDPWDDRDTEGKGMGAQTIRCLCLYRWERHDRWHIRGKSGVIADLQAALERGYRWSEMQSDVAEPEPSTGFTPEEADRCREGLANVPATAKAAVERGYYWLKEQFVPGEPYAFALVYDPQARRYLALKLETRRWRVVAEMELQGVGPTVPRPGSDSPVAPGHLGRESYAHPAAGARAASP